MKRNKEKILLRFKDGKLDTKCICLQILDLKRAKLRGRYEAAKINLNNAKVAGKPIDRILAQVMKTGNKLRAIQEAMRDIEAVYKITNNLIQVEINGETVSRLSHNTDYKRSCRDKVPYSERTVKIAAAETSQKFNEIMEPYKCRYCEFWHVGHSVAFYTYGLEQKNRPLIATAENEHLQE